MEKAEQARLVKEKYIVRSKKTHQNEKPPPNPKTNDSKIIYINI